MVQKVSDKVKTVHEIKSIVSSCVIGRRAAVKSLPIFLFFGGYENHNNPTNWNDLALGLYS